MSHKIPPRTVEMEAFKTAIINAVIESGVTLTETCNVFHGLIETAVRRHSLRWDNLKEISSGTSQGYVTVLEELHGAEMALVKTVLRPWENQTCPTCPKD